MSERRAAPEAELVIRRLRDARGCRAELAELRAQIRHLADEYRERAEELERRAQAFSRADDAHVELVRSASRDRAAARRLRELVGPWPHERPTSIRAMLDGETRSSCPFCAAPTGSGQCWDPAGTTGSVPACAKEASS